MYVFACEIHTIEITVPKLPTSFVESYIWDEKKTETNSQVDVDGNNFFYLFMNT